MPNYKDNASAVFKAMQSDGVTGIGKDENEFYELMKKPENRSSVYSYLTSNEYTGIGNSLDEFTNMVYDPNTNRAVETPKQKSAWESTVERFTPSVKGAPMMLTPTGQQEYKKAQEQKQIQKVFDRKSEADKAIDKVNEKVTSPYAPIPSVTEQAKRSLPDAQEEQNQIDELFDKTINEIQEKGQAARDKSINTTTNLPVMNSPYAAMARGILADKAYNEEVTPSKIIGAIQEQIMNNGSQTGSDGNNESVDPIQQTVGEKASKLQAQRIYDYVRQKLIERNVPQSKWETFFRTLISNNLVLNLSKSAIMTPEQLQYDAQSMSEEYNKENQLDAVSNVAANVLGVATDPTTYISAGAGSAAANMTTKFMLNSASKWGVNQATRFMMSRGANWMLPKVVGGMANFATFEGLGSVSGRLGSGQDVNWGDVAFSTAKGAGMGAIMPVFSNIFTSGIEKTLGRYSASYGGKVLKYGGDLTARTAIFAGGNVVQQWATNPNFDWRTADYGEIVGDALATNLGFDLFHLGQNLIFHPKETVSRIVSTKKSPDLAFTKDDVRTAKACGLDVKDGDINSLINALGKIAEEDAKNGQKYNTDATAKDLNKYLNESGLGQILQHENMTQSLAAKIKSAVTGKAEIPMITNAEVSYDENDKMFHARTFNSVGVVEDRAFSSRKDANNFFNSKVDECRVGRVKEMECSLTAQNIAKTTSEVGELVARKFKLTNEEFKKILNKKGELTPEEKSVMDAYNAMLNTEEAPTRFVEDARKATAEEYKISLDMMDKIAESDYKSLSAKEKNIYRFYEEKLRLTKEENFKSETSTENGNPTEGESKSQLTDYTDPSTGKHDTFIYDSTGNGMSMNDAWDEGGKLNPTEVKERLSKSASQIDPAVKASIDKAFDDNTVMDLLRQMDGNMDDNVIAYIKAKMNQKGLYSVAVSESGNAASLSVINKYGKQSGTVRKGIIGGKEVVITGNPTDEFCYYKNPETGNIDRCDWRMISEMTEANVEDLISEAAEAAKAETKAKIDHQFAHEPETHQDYKAGDDFYALNEKGESKHYQVVGVDENGNVTYGELNDKGEPTNMKVATKEQLKSMEDESYLVRNGLVEKNAETTPTETVATETEAPQTETAPVESVAPVEEAKPQSALDRIPKDKNGKEIWTQAENPSDVIDGLTEKLNGNSQRAEELIDNMIASTKSNLEKAEKVEVKPSDDLNKMLDDEQKKNDNIETAKKNLEYWENVKKEIENRKVEEERKQNEQNENDVLNNAIEQANNETPTEEVTTEETPVEEPQQKTVEEIDSEIKELDKQLRSLLNIKDDRDIDSQTINSRTPKVGNKREKANNLLEQINALKEERKSVAPEEVVEEAPQTVTSEEAASIADTVNTPTDAELASEEYDARMQANLSAIEKKKQETIQKAVGVAITEGKRLGTNINVLYTPEELKAVLGEGYDDMSPENVNAFTLPNGKVYIYAPSMKSEKFAVRQVWHEVIGHNGIKAILNAKDRTQFYSDIFKFMDEKAKDRFGRYVYGSMDKDSRDALGFDSYDELVKNAEAKQKFFNDNFETIADEYVARNYAEGGEFEKGVWQTIKDMFTHYAHSLGFGAFSDADIRYMLGRADKNIVVKNGYAKVNAKTVKEDIVGAFKKMMDGDNVKVAFGISAPVKDTKIGMKPLTAQQIENLRQMTGQSESDIVNTYGVNKNVKFSKEEDEKKPRLQGGLYSNAEKAVLDIKQNKATADQWLNMLKNNGGLKEGEDKWIGLSDWLRNRRGMTTKEEVLYYIADARQTKHIVDASPEEREDAAVRFSVVKDKDKVEKFEKDIRFSYTTDENGRALSERALDAKDNGTYPKMEFRKAYDINGKTFDALKDLHFISNSEWHHTGKNFNQTDFYSWWDSDKAHGSTDYSESYEAGEDLLAKYNANKDKIKSLAEKASKLDWQFKDKESVPEFGMFAHNVAEKEVSLTPEEENMKKNGHVAISNSGEPSAYMRKLEHEDLDNKYYTILSNRRDEYVKEHESELRQMYDEKYGDIIKSNEEIDKYNASTDGKEKALKEIATLMGETPEEATRLVNGVSRTARDQIKRDAEQKDYESRKAEAKVLADKKQKELDKWVQKNISEGKIKVVDRVKKDDLPENFVETKREMYGKYGWFESQPYKYRLPEYYSGYGFESKRTKTAYDNRVQDIRNTQNLRFSINEDDGIERDASGRPIYPEISKADILTPEGRKKYQAWENAVKAWDKAHPLDMKNRKAAAKTVAKVVKQALEEGGLSEVEVAELNKFMNTMSNTNTTNIVAMTSRAFKIAAGAISKANNKTIDRLLSLKLTDRNGKNMSIAGSVDYNAQEIFKMLKANWETFDSESVQKRIDKLNEKMDKHAEAVANGEKPEEAWTQDDSNELTALETLLKNKTVREVANEIKEIIDEQRELEKQRKENYAKYKNAEISPDEYKVERDRIKVKEDALDVEMNERLNAKMDAEQAVINTLTELAEGGREDKQSWIEREQNRKRDLISNMTLNLWSDKKVDPQEMSDYTKEGGKSEFMKTVKPAFTVMASSFEYLAKNLNEYGAGKDSWFYNYFIRGKEGVLQASSDYYDSMRKHQETLDAKCKEIFGKDYNSVLKEMSKEFEHSGVHVDLAYESNRIRGDQGGKTELSLSKGEATYLYMLWKMNDGNAQLLRDGFTLDSMQEIEDFIGEKNVKFAEWMQNEYLPEMRKKYNDKYIELFNTSLAHVDNYVPLKRVSEMAQQSSDLNDETNYKDVLTASTGAIINRTRSKNPINLGTNAYQLIFDHLNEMEKWHAYARVRKDLDIILGSTHLRNKMNRNSAGMHTRLKYAAATATLVPNNRELNTLDEALAKMSKMLAGAPIAFRNTTALKQYASLVNGFRYATDALFIPEMIARSVEDITLNTPAWFKNVAKMGFGTQEALKRAANGDSYWKTGFSPNLSWCLQNIPDFYERVLKGTAGNANLEFDTWDNAVGAFADEYMKKGMISNQLIDAITCSIIIRSVYDGKMRVYKKQGMPFEEADRQAKMDAVVAYNSSQQSSHPAFLAPAQKSKKAMDRAYSLFNTANLGFARDFITSMSDCLRLMKPESKSFYTHKLMNENPDMTREEAEKIANKEIRKAYGWAMSGILFSGFVGALSWDFHSKGLLGALQNEEEDKDKRRNNLIKQFISCPARGIPPVDVGVALISAYLDGDKASGIASKLLKQNLLSSQLEKIFRETGTAYEDFGFSPELAYSVINNCATIPNLGVDLNTHVNMIQGVSAMVRDGIVSPYFGTDSANTKDKLMLDIMQILNTPKSNRTEVMKTLLKDKVVNDEISYEDYMRLVEIAAGYKVDNDPIRSWMPNARLLKEAKKNEFKKEFESYFLSLDDKKEMKENDEKRKEMSEVGKEESNANKFEDFALHTSRTREFMKHKKEYDEYKTLSSVNSAWKRLLQNNPDEADKFEKEHKEELERYRDNIGKFKSISSQLKLFGMEGEDKNEIFDEIIKALSEE